MTKVAALFMGAVLPIQLDKFKTLWDYLCTSELLVDKAKNLEYDKPQMHSGSYEPCL